jgi:cell wall-associated NlpC family hydrolase
LSAQSVQLGTDVERPAKRGRHRAQAAPSGVTRIRARAAVAAVTTGTVAVSGVALAGCATSAPTDPGVDEISATSPINLGAQLGSEASLAALRAVNTGSTVVNVSDISSQLTAQSTLQGKSAPLLSVTNPAVTVRANQPVSMGFSLRDQASGAPLANELVKVQVKQPAGWTTFKYLYTDSKGYTSYTAKVLTTTQITAIFDGADGYRSTHSTNVGTLTVAPTPAPPVQASRTTTRTSLATATASVSATVSAPVPTSSLGEKAVYLASTQAGKPYVYGAVGPYSFDCSGLVQYVFKQLGRSLPRTAQDQYNATTRVSQYNKQVGDLIFFGTPGDIYHVGIYAGDGKMWVAPRSGEDVQLEAIYSTSYSVGRVL